MCSGVRPRFELIGVGQLISGTCGDPNGTSLFTRTTAIQEWIESSIETSINTPTLLVKGRTNTVPWPILVATHATDVIERTGSATQLKEFVFQVDPSLNQADFDTLPTGVWHRA
jgi:hypothetical protein